MSVKGDARQALQLELYNSFQEIKIGSLSDLPLPLGVLLNIEEHPEYLIQKIEGGLSGIVYKIQVDGVDYNLKKERRDILVKNPDGQTSFMNEIQIRQRIELFRKSPGYEGEFENIIKTIYASKNNGIMLSPWIDAQHIQTVRPELIRSLFTTYLNLEKKGIFDLDPCSGNLLVQDDRIILFDFGYTYLFDPLTDFNPDGREFGLMHMAERFESRFFFQYLMDLEESAGLAAALEQYRMEKEIALDIYRQKYSWLLGRDAQEEVLDYVRGFILQWEKGLSSEEDLQKLYSLESFLSYSMDAKDDLHGQTCTPGTLKKIDRIIKALESSYNSLKVRGMLWGNEARMDQAEILDFWKENLRKAHDWQIH